MKFLLMMILTLSGLSALAEEGSYLLTPEELKTLSRDQQAHYIKSVQKILAKMAKQTLYMASTDESRSSRGPASLIQPTNPPKKQVDELIEKSLEEAEKRRLKAAAALALSATPSPVTSSSVTAATTSPTTGATTSPVTSKATFTDTNSKGFIIGSSDKSVTPPTKKPVKKEVIITETQAEQGRDVPPPQTTKEEFIITETQAEQGRDVPPPQTTVKKTPPKSTQNTKPQTAKPKTEKNQTKTEKATYFRCMYSGWVVEKDPCQAQQAFPDYYSIEGVDKSKMKCSSSQTMCNPTVFGLHLPKTCKSLLDGDCRLQAKPLCVSKGAWPTEDCYHLSTYQDALVAAEINTEISPDQYKHYAEAFEDLCDPKKIKTNPFTEEKNGKARSDKSKKAIQDDIRITCGWAKKQLLLAKEALDIETQSADEKAKSEARKKWDSKKSGSQQ